MIPALPSYFANAILRIERSPRGGPWRATVLCGCGCMGEGIVTSTLVEHLLKRYGDDLRGSLLTFEEHGPGVHTGRGGILWLSPAPPVVLYVDTQRINARDLVAAANAALRGLGRGAARA